jgi:hypothetical protein
MFPWPCVRVCEEEKRREEKRRRGEERRGEAFL